MTHRVDLCFRATALLLICYGPAEWYLRSGCWMLMGIALLNDQWRHRGSLWLTTSIMLALGAGFNWTTADNHKYLMAYWCLALCCACRAGDRKHSVLQSNASLLTGLVMLLGTVWKLSSADYRSGAFFEFTFLTDHRFIPLVTALTDVTRQDVLTNGEILNQLTTGYVENVNPQSVVLNFAPAVRHLAMVVTWWTVAIEGLCAAAFLWPSCQNRRVRHVLLLAFAATTYAVAPIAGFGGLLLVMGMTLTAESPTITYRIYAVMFLFVLIAPVFVGPLLNTLAR